MEYAIIEIQKLEQLLFELLQCLDFKNKILLVISDHGNIEDLRVKSHTLNPVYMALWGEKKKMVFNSILAIYPYLMERIAT